MVRRSGLLHALHEDDTDYVTDLADLAPTDKKSADLRALLRWLSTEFTLRDLIADAPFPHDVSPSQVLPVVRAGRHELVSMICRLVPSTSPLRRGWHPRL